MEYLYHGIDKHKHYSSISCLNQEGKEIMFNGHCRNLKKYITDLNNSDTVVMEASNGSFYWADQVEKVGAKCIIIDPYKFKIIKDSWKKTDKIDARAMSNSLIISETSNNFKLPVVIKPKSEVRELRKYFATYTSLNKQIVSLKNIIQAQLSDDGICLSVTDKSNLFKSKLNNDILNNLEITEATKICIQTNLVLLELILAQKEKIKKDILYFGKYFEKEIKILITIKGVSVFMALAYLADVEDVKRFRSQRKMNAYLGVVPGIKSSGGKTYTGHINRASRKLARSIFTQSIHHVIDSNPMYREKYNDLLCRRGAGRARIAFIRRIFGVMRRMLLTEEGFKYIDKNLYESKLNTYYRDIKKYEKLKRVS